MAVQHILVVERDQELNRALVDQLEADGFQATGVESGQAALAFVEKKGLPHLAVIDVAETDVPGLDVAEIFWNRGVPLIVTGEGDSSMAVESLKRADDFVRKPYAPQEIAARAHAILRRVGDLGYAGGPVAEIDGRVSVDYVHDALIVEGEPIPLTPVEGRLLHTLLKQRGRTVDNRALLLRVWSVEGVYEDTLRVHVHRLRAKIEPDPRHPRYVTTQRSVGYAFRA